MRLPLITALWFSLAGSAVAATSDPPSPPVATLIQGVSVIDVERGVATEARDILIASGRIAAVGPVGSLSVPATAKRIDGRGLYAAPGLVDVHVHLGEGGALPPDENSRARALRQFLRYGVTTIFLPGGADGGDADLRPLMQACAAAPLTCPGLAGSASLITAPGSHPISTIFSLPLDTPPDVVAPRGVAVLLPDADVDAVVAARQAAGASAIKIIIEDGPPPWRPKPRLSDQQVRDLTAAAHRRALPVFAHVSAADHVGIALDSKVDALMHGVIDPLPDEMVRRMAEQRIVYVPTFALYDGILTWARKERESDPYALAGAPEPVIASLASPGFLAAAPEDEATALSYLENASDNLRRVVAAGVPVALGSDVNNPFVYPGFSAHEELSWMVRVGLSPAQALRAGTLGGAAMLGQADRIGRIAPGYEADLVLLSGDPLLDIANSRRLVAVFSDGLQVQDIVAVGP